MTRDLISVCPHCGYHHSAITAVTPVADSHKREPKPTAGSVTLCSNCGGWCVIDKWQRLQKPSAKLLRQIESDDITVKLRLSWLLSNAMRSMLQ